MTEHVHYEVTGRGDTTICLVHGSGGTHGVWIRQMEGLADLARIVAIDLPGHGESGGDGVGTIDRAAATVRDVLDRVGVARAVIGGHSMGGAIALAFALANLERTAGLLLIGTGARLRVLPKIFETLERDYAEGVRFVVDLAVAANTAPETKDALARQTLRNPRPAMIGDFRACDAFDVMTRLGEIRAPTLVVCGDEDQLTPVKYSRYLHDHIAGAQLVVVPGAGHYVQLERPDETTAAIRQFLAANPEPRVRCPRG
jgi:pimeloyl-ACP methyl ester carboxylesterase